RRLVLSFAHVEYLSSAALATLFTTEKKLRRARGRLVCCNVDSQIYEVFQITNTDKLLIVAADETEALQALDDHAVVTSCPVEGCGGSGRSLHTVAQGDPFPRVQWEERCSACGARFGVEVTQLPATGEAAGRVTELSLPTYQDEQVGLTYR